MVSPRFLLIIKVKNLHYYIGFTQNRDFVLGAPSNSENNQNADVRVQAHVQMTLPIGF